MELHKLQQHNLGAVGNKEIYCCYFVCATYARSLSDS